MPEFDYRYNPEYHTPDPDLIALKSTVLGHGGNRFQYDGVLEDQLGVDCRRALLADGREFGTGTYIKGYPTSRCHDNVLAHLKRIGFPPAFEPFIGFALGSDGCWRVHSWIVRSGTMAVDVTVPGTRLYFGVPWSLAGMFDI